MGNDSLAALPEATLQVQQLVAVGAVRPEEVAREGVTAATGVHAAVSQLRRGAGLPGTATTAVLWQCRGRKADAQRCSVAVTSDAGWGARRRVNCSTTVRSAQRMHGAQKGAWTMHNRERALLLPCDSATPGALAALILHIRRSSRYAV